MSEYKLVPVEPTDEMVSAAEDAYMPFGDMEMAIRMAVLAAPAVQGEPVAVPQVMGIGRDTSLPRAVILYLRSEPTDDDVRSIQDALRTGWAQPAEQQPLPCQECGGDGAGGEHEDDCARAQPAELEILGSYPVSGQIFFREPSNEWVLELTGSVNGTRFTARHTQPADTRPEDVAGLPALYEPAPDVAGLVEALEQCITSMLDSGYRADAVVIRAARTALAAHRKQGGEV